MALDGRRHCDGWPLGPGRRSSSTARSETPGAPPSLNSWSPTPPGRKATGRGRRSSSARACDSSASSATEHYALRAARAHAWAYYEGGDLERARELYEEIIRQAREAHDPFPEGVALGILGDIAVDQGRPEDAVSLTRRAIGSSATSTTCS